MITKWTSIKSVIFELERIIPKDLYNEQRLIEDCMRACDFIGAVPTYQQAIRFIRVSNYKAALPNDCLQIIQIAHKNNWLLTPQDLQTIDEMLGIQNDPTMASSTLPLQVWFAAQPFYRLWTPLKLSTSSFALSVHCDNSININCSCDYEYTVTPDGCMTFSFKEGFICVAYYCYPKDQDGTPLIPDQEDYKEALRNYCLMVNWELRWNIKEEGSSERYLKYQQLWGLYKAKATASMRMPNVEKAENLKNIYTALIPKTRRFSNFFNDLNKEENLDMGGFSSHYLYRQ